jgi:SAM-dependent methyltransferase
MLRLRNRLGKSSTLGRILAISLCLLRTRLEVTYVLRCSNGLGSRVSQFNGRCPRLVTYAKELLGPCRAGTARALDIGSGYGFFSRAARDQGFQVTAVNPASEENRIFQQLNGVESIPRFFEAVDFDTEKFDLVILSQVLEHLLDPLHVLVKVRNLIKPQGVLAIAVPNVDAILIKILKSRSSFLGLPDHIIHFSRQGLSALLQRAGFEVNHHIYVSRIPYFSISNRLNIHGRSRQCVNFLVRIFQWPPLFIANRLGLGLFQNVWAVPVRQGRATL